jgi:hypothetical protein
VYTLHDLSHHSNGVEHFLLSSVNGSLQYVAKHANHIIAAYPELCHEGPDPALLQTRRKRHQKGDPKKDPPKKGGSPKNLDPKTDHLVKDCEDLFARTAKEKCGEEFELKTLNAVEKVIDGLAIEMQVEVGKKGEDKTKGITSANADSMKTSENPQIKRLVGAEGEMGAAFGLDNEWRGVALKLIMLVITQVGYNIRKFE